MAFELTDHQIAVSLQVGDFLDGSSNVLLLTGAAGTGKTTLLAELVKKAMTKWRLRVMVCAPTHTATEVISSKINRRANTLQSFLKLKPRYDDDGNQEFVTTDETGQHDYNLIIIDESSMINTNLFNILQSNITCKIIYVGDDYQLPPVKETESLVFHSGFRQVTLLEQLRTDIFGDIYDDFRGFVDSGIFPEIPDHLRIDKYNKNDVILEIYREYPDTKILAHRNSQVKEYNLMIKEALFAEDEYCVGERMRFTNYHEIDYTAFYTGFEFEIVSASEAKQEHAWGEFWIWKIGFEHEGRLWFINVISNMSRHKWTPALFRNKRQEASKPKYKRNWKHYYDLVAAADAPVRRAYGSTVYSAQGQTYNSVIIDVGDIMYTARENNRKCVYTAVTRPSKHIWFIM